MKSLRKTGGFLFSGGAAGAVNGLFGAGGGMILVPLLTKFARLEEADVFPTSVSIIFPICFVSLFMSHGFDRLPLEQALPYLLGSIPGGILAAFIGKHLSVKWLHRILGIMILYGGVQYLC